MSYRSGDTWEGTVGPYTFAFPNVENPGTVTVTATDPTGNRASSGTPLTYYTTGAMKARGAAVCDGGSLRGHSRGLSPGT
jgi:hypothetical protein